MIPVLHGIPNCDTVRKARAWLSAAGIAHSFHDHRRDGVDKAVLMRAVAEHGWDAVLNRKGTSFRALPDAAKTDLDGDRATGLMIEHPSTIRRPLLDLGDRTVLGFSADRYQALFSVA